MNLNDNRTEDQKKALRIAEWAGFFRDLAINCGGTGHQRKELTTKQKAKKKIRKQMKKQARKANRKAG